MHIKKTILFLIFFLLFVHSQASAFEATSTFRIINNKNETLLSKEVSFQEGDTLYDVIKKTFEIDESEGHIVSINGIHSIPNKNIHWAFFVNGKFIELGVDEIVLYANDDVVCALRDFDQEEILK